MSDYTRMMQLFFFRLNAATVRERVYSLKALRTRDPKAPEDHRRFIHQAAKDVT